MRDLHLYSGNLFGGIESLLLTLARCRALCPDLEPHFGLCFAGRLEQGLRGLQAPVHLLGPARVSRPWTVWAVRRRLADHLKRQRPDVVVCHSCWPHAVFAPVARRFGLPVVFWAHDVHRGRHWLERWAGMTAPDLVVANSRFTAAAVPALFPAAPCRVLHLPVADSNPADRAAARGEVRRELNTPPDAVVIVQACRLERWKGHALHLQALARLKDLPGWECWIAGGVQRAQEQAYLDELRRLAEAGGVGGRVRFLGQRSDVPRLLAAADVHCQPNSAPEPFGVALVEALYAGLPVVTSAQGGAVEIVDDRCGVLVPPGDVGRLEEALRRLIQDEGLRRRLGQAGPARAQQLCSPAAQLRKLHEFLGESVPRKAVS
jgi:glycosyltransferase involved in cell wall biosynthesis